MRAATVSAKVKKILVVGRRKVSIYHLPSVGDLGWPSPERLPYAIKVLLESALRRCDGRAVTVEDVAALAGWTPRGSGGQIRFHPGRVVLQDFTGVPCLVDLAAMRSAMARLGGDPAKVNPSVPCDLVVDHSIQVDAYGSSRALAVNLAREFQRNGERYAFLKWGQKAFSRFRLIPPGSGIIHQVNLEYLATGVLRTSVEGEEIVYPDSLVGTDSHTTMINGLGVVGWGVGGIEAEAVMLGEPIAMALPAVIGVRLRGRPAAGVTATDIVLSLTELLRRRGVVGCFVEFFGEGLSVLRLPDRATLANMAPEYGATMGLFPVDEETLRYYRATGRRPADVALLRAYLEEQGMFFRPGAPEPDYTDVVDFDLGAVVPCLAGPKRPQDRVPVRELKTSFHGALVEPTDRRGFGLPRSRVSASASLEDGTRLTHGSVVLAAITSCTNTSNPDLLVAAGLLARNAVRRGLRTPPFVKTSFAPGSRAAEAYLREAGLLRFLERLRFHVVGFGCTTCIGNSGPLPEDAAEAVTREGLVAAAVLSGNRNFEGRVHPLVKANYLASPPLVVAYALAGTVAVNLEKEPLGTDSRGRPVYLHEIWPTAEEIRDHVERFVTPQVFREKYRRITSGGEEWSAIRVRGTVLYPWDPRSTYIQEPPFFSDLVRLPVPRDGISGARVLVMLGDSVTTDHISPAGPIAPDSPAGRYLRELGVSPEAFNSYGSRRGNDRVMTRGTFANVRLKNLLAPGTEGAWTRHWPDGVRMSIFDAASRYREEGVPLIVLAGREYGTGSSRDWAAKGVALLGVRAVVARSFERIHRSNLVGMGVLPLEFPEGVSRESLGLRGDEVFDLSGTETPIAPHARVKATVVSPDGRRRSFALRCRIDTPMEAEYFRHGGILPYVLRKMLG